MPRVLEVNLLGPPRVVRDGELVAFDTRKAVALLSHLAMTARPRSRDSLADLLWPDSDSDHARAALRRTLSSVRSAVGPAFLEATRDHVRLVRAPGLVVDVDVFRSFRLSRAEDAVTVFRGDFLEGFVVRDAPAFDDWAQAEAEALRRELVATLAGLTKDRRAAGDTQGALVAARRWLSADPLHEPAHQALIALYAAVGDRAAALTQYRECVRTLSRELGVPPLSETTELYEAVNRGAHAVPPPVPASRAPATEPSLPSSLPSSLASSSPAPRLPGMVGRSRELAELRSAYDAVGPDGAVVLVEGEAGIGKTRLAEEFVATLHADGATVLLGRAFEDERGLAFGPVTEALGLRLRDSRDWLAAVEARALHEAARLVPDLLPRGRQTRAPGAEGPGAETRFLSGVWETIVSAAAGPRPGVLFLDDVQWADDATLGLLSYGLRRLAGRPLLVLLTGRSPYDHALRRAAVSDALRGRARVLTLGRLPESTVAEMLRVVRRPDETGDTARRLWERTEGVPLFLVEYLHSVEQQGELPLPAGARELLRARLAPLSETARQTLSAAAVIGRSFDTDAVRIVSGRTDDETVTSVEELVRRGLLRERSHDHDHDHDDDHDHDHDYDFGHGLVRAAVYEETSLARRRLLHGRAADLPGAPAPVVARHLQLAGRERDAAHAYRAAGEQALLVYATTDALAHLRAALALGHVDVAGLQLQIGGLLTLLGDYAGAQSSLEAAAADSGPDLLPEVEQRLGRLHHRRGDHLLAQAHLEAALEATPQDRTAQRASITADLSLVAQAAGQPALARSLATRAHLLAQEGGDLRALCQSMNLLGMLATLEDDIDDAVALLERSRELADRLGAPDLQVAALNNLALAHRARNELTEALELTAAALELCTATREDRHHEAALHNNLADLFHAAGRSAESMDHLKKAVEIFAEVGVDDVPRPGIWKLVRW
jgi:DNA-binding SARP family transcriptional activator